MQALDNLTVELEGNNLRDWTMKWNRRGEDDAGVKSCPSMAGRRTGPYFAFALVMLSFVALLLRLYVATDNFWLDENWCGLASVPQGVQVVTARRYGYYRVSPPSIARFFSILPIYSVSSAGAFILAIFKNVTASPVFPMDAADIPS